MLDHARASRIPQRIAARPSPDQWGADEILSLAEAASLFWPGGPLSTRSLRTAARDGALATVWIAGKQFTSKGALAAMTRCKPDDPKKPPVRKAEPPDDRNPAGQPADLSASGTRLLDRIAAERARLGRRPRRAGD